MQDAHFALFNPPFRVAAFRPPWRCPNHWFAERPNPTVFTIYDALSFSCCHRCRFIDCCDINLRKAGVKVEIALFLK
jgi:hypothetical protein